MVIPIEVEKETSLSPFVHLIFLEEDIPNCIPDICLHVDSHCLDLEEVDEELFDLGVESHAVEDRGARKGSQREDQCVRRRTKFFSGAIKFFIEAIRKKKTFCRSKVPVIST